jgi:hypothetical protein
LEQAVEAQGIEAAADDEADEDGLSDAELLEEFEEAGDGEPGTDDADA